MKLERLGEKIQGQKRQRMPFTIHWTCPVCGKKQKLNLRDNYLSYPTFGNKRVVDLYCENEECNKDLEPAKKVEIIPKVDIKIVSEKGTGKSNKK